MSDLGELARLRAQAGHPTLVLRRGKGASPQHGVPDAVVEAADARAADVCLAGVPAPLVVRHLSELHLMSRTREADPGNISGCHSWRWHWHEPVRESTAAHKEAEYI